MYEKNGKKHRFQQQLLNISTRCIFLNNKYVFCVKKEVNYLDIFHLENRVNLLKKISQIRWVKFKRWKLVVIETAFRIWGWSWYANAWKVPDQEMYLILRNNTHVKYIAYLSFYHQYNQSEAWASLRHNSFTYFHGFPLTPSQTKYI